MKQSMVLSLVSICRCCDPVQSYFNSLSKFTWWMTCYWV